MSAKKTENKQPDRYVSRAALKLESIADKFGLDFAGKVVLDVGSSTGGFTEYALKQGASKVIAVDVGKNQMHTKLRGDKRVDLHEQTDIRDMKQLSNEPDIVVIDVSFVSLRDVLPYAANLSGSLTQIVALVKPQFESSSNEKHKGIIKNETIRRSILKEFESWAKSRFVITKKADSKVAGAKGNLERFYLLKKMA